MATIIQPHLKREFKALNRKF